MMVRVDGDLARAAIVHWFATQPPEEAGKPNDETDFICYTPQGPIRIPPQKKDHMAEIIVAARMVPEWLAEVLKRGTIINLSRADFYGLPEEVRKYVEVF